MVDRANTARNSVMMADEFLLQYLVTAGYQFLVTSRLFSMGQSIELYAKAAITSRFPEKQAWGHDVPRLLSKLDPSLLLTTEEIAAGQTLFTARVPSFDLDLQMQHAEALELYQAEYFLVDLKYYYGKNELPIYPVRISLALINHRYLKLVDRLRSMVAVDLTTANQSLTRAAGITAQIDDVLSTILMSTDDDRQT